ncbi:hypothetical protein DSO57_1009679 [Entomophthora muscae]|uniref:Uncharacterized protein n=1 Tax=Entomophthora muscae TaxID=34485 RepID=A0ACC2THI8_9FUNG|nr:hypothetical protein DSO57_1009679 [Entomophthora muscae]
MSDFSGNCRLWVYRADTGCIRNEISAPLKNQDLEQLLSPGHDCLWTASSENKGSSCLCFLGSNSLEERAPRKEIPVMVPSKGHNELPNGGKEATSIDLMSLMSIIVTNQNPKSEENLVQRAVPKSIALEQKGCTTLLKDLVNGCPFCTSSILLPQNWSTCPSEFKFPKHLDPAH